MLDSGSREERSKEDHVEENYKDNNNLYYEEDRPGKLSRFLPKGYLIKSLDPRIITGAADEDPSTIGTYSQAGAQFGFGLLWLALFQYPMIVIMYIKTRNVKLKFKAKSGQVKGIAILTAGIRSFDS